MGGAEALTPRGTPPGARGKRGERGAEKTREPALRRDRHEAGLSAEPPRFQQLHVRRNLSCELALRGTGTRAPTGNRTQGAWVCSRAGLQVRGHSPSGERVALATSCGCEHLRILPTTAPSLSLLSSGLRIECPSFAQQGCDQEEKSTLWVSPPASAGCLPNPHLLHTRLTSRFTVPAAPPGTGRTRL